MVAGIDLLVSRRRANVSSLELAKEMGVSRQYVTKLEGQESVTAEAAGSYRGALRALEDGHQTVTIEADGLAADYRAARRAAAKAVGAAVSGKRSLRVLAGPAASWLTVLGLVDGATSVGVPARVILSADESDPVELRR